MTYWFTEEQPSRCVRRTAADCGNTTRARRCSSKKVCAKAPDEISNCAFVAASRGAQRGTASVEGAVVLPVFVIVFIGVLFVRDMASARFEAKQVARRCAWEYSNNNCSSIPVGCSDVLSEPRLDFEADNLVDFESKLKNGLNGIQEGNGKSGIQRILTDLVEGYIVKALTWKVDARKAVQRERPRLFGGGTSYVPGSYRLACNIPGPVGKNLIYDIWHAIKGR